MFSHDWLLRSRWVGRALTIVGCGQLEELAPSMRQATSLCHTQAEAGLLAGVVVANQAAAPVAQECAGVQTGARLAEVIDHRLMSCNAPGA